MNPLKYLLCILLMYWLYAVNLNSSSTLHSGLKLFGGTILHIPKGSACLRIRMIYCSGSLNSASVGRKIGACIICACWPRRGNCFPVWTAPIRHFGRRFDVPLDEPLPEAVGILCAELSAVLWEWRARRADPGSRAWLVLGMASSARRIRLKQIYHIIF